MLRSTELRQEIINEFNDEKNKDSMVLLLTLKVGDVGLNLIGGNHLFIFEMPWNPAIEQQARDRIYRIGQKKPVYVYKYLFIILFYYLIIYKLDLSSKIR